MKTHDCLGRRLFDIRARNPKLSRHTTEREFRWLKFLNWHGLASSLYLHEHTKDTHRCSQTSKRMLRRLFDAGLIEKPEQQLATVDARSNHHIYALSQLGVDYLKDEELWVDPLEPTGHWVHQYMVASITASIHILCNRTGLIFIPGHEITNKLAVEVPFRWKDSYHTCKLIPDSLFAIKYPNGFIAYALEADRSTETIDPATPFRKSVRRNVKQYAQLVGRGIYKEAYGLHCPLVILTVAVSPTHIKRSLKIINEEVGTCKYMAYGLAPTFRTPFKPPTALLYDIFNQPLLRNGLNGLLISKSG